MSFNRRFSSSSLSSKRKPSGWSAWSVIDEAAELIGGNGPVDPMLAEALGQAPPEVVLAAIVVNARFPLVPGISDGAHAAKSLGFAPGLLQ